MLMITSATKKRLNMRRPLGIPYILTYVHPDGDITNDIERKPGASLEIPEFIKDAIIGKVHLVIESTRVLL